MQTVAVIDYGMGNLHSVAKALEHVGAGKVLITSDANVIREADRGVVPGVGAIRDCMAEIRRLGFDSLVREVSQDRPFLGICVGMQALLDRSEENDGVDCIGLFPGQVKFFGKDLHEDGAHLKIPHMCWNEASQTADHPRGHDIPDLVPFPPRAQLLPPTRSSPPARGARPRRRRFPNRQGRGGGAWRLGGAWRGGRRWGKGRRSVQPGSWQCAVRNPAGPAGVPHELRAISRKPGPA